MYKIEWDTESGGVLLRQGATAATLGVAPRPVFHEELDLIGLDALGFTYPRGEAPLLWAVNKQYWYRGTLLFQVRGADIYTRPAVVLADGVRPQSLAAVDVQTMLSRNDALMAALESEAVEFIRSTFSTYSRASRTAERQGAQGLDYAALAERTAKRAKREMAVVREDCDSFDVMPAETAREAGKTILLATHIDRFIASFSGGKDSQVVLDLCTRAMAPADFTVIYSDTGYELPPSLTLYDEVRHHYQRRFPALRFLTARNHAPVLDYWDTIGTPSDTHRWCCSVMKTAPLYRMLKTDGNKQAHVLTFDGVRAEESTRRESYARSGNGKHTFVYNAHPILLWNAVEIFLYLFKYSLPINPAYRFGKARVGCLTCPFSTAWDDMVTNACYGKDLQPFIDRLRKYSAQIDIHNVEGYISERRWKLKPLADRDRKLPVVTIKGDVSLLNFYAEIKGARQSWDVWLPALCEYTMKDTPTGKAGELHVLSEVHPYEITERDDTTAINVYGRIGKDLLYLLRRLVYKTAYCINCEVCEVDCPTGALSIVPIIKIDKQKCIHCHKCYNTHDRGCIAADCTRMINDTERKLNTKVQGYKTFGLRGDWIDEYFANAEDFWGENTLGTAQVEAFKAWLRDAEIIDRKAQLTPLGVTMQGIYADNPLLFWEICFINLSYHSYIVKWVCANIPAGRVYNKKYIHEEAVALGFGGALTTLDNAAAAFIDLAKKSPVGEDMMQGVSQGKDGLRREAYNGVSIEAVAYSLYRFAAEHELNMLRVSDLYKDEEEHGVYKEFRIEKDALLKKLRTLSSGSNRVLVAELNMGLEHITLRDDLTPQQALETLVS